MNTNSETEAFDNEHDQDPFLGPGSRADEFADGAPLSHDKCISSIRRVR